jgi:hypothetical protein
LYKFNPEIKLENIKVGERNVKFEEQIKTTGEISVTASKTVIGALFILNMPLALTLIKLLQFFEFFNLLNLEYPANLLMFFELFKGDIFNFLPNPFENLSNENSFVETCEPRGRMGEEEMSCSFLLNSGDFIALLFVLIVIKLLIMTVKFVFRLRF